MRPWLLALILLLAACRGDPQKCDAGCRRFAELEFWKRADAEIAAAPVAQREALRAKKGDEFNAALGRGLALCVSQCTSVMGGTDHAECLIKARTFEQATACGD